MLYPWDIKFCHLFGIASGETYGLQFNLPNLRISFIVDTAYFGLVNSYQGTDLLIMNLMLFDPPESISNI